MFFTFDLDLITGIFTEEHFVSFLDQLLDFFVRTRKARSARWYWEKGEHLAYAGWSHHLPGYEGSGGQRQWVSYCKHTISACHMFCSFLR